MWRHPVRSAAVAAALLTASGGCLAYSVDNTTVTGRAVSAGTFDHLAVGATTDWVTANLGQPTSKVTTGTDEVWRYDHDEQTQHFDVIVFVYFGQRQTDRRDTLYVEFDKGLVTSKWRG